MAASLRGARLPPPSCPKGIAWWPRRYCRKRLGVDDSTSKTPSVRRKWRSGATRIERTPRRRQLAESTRGFDSAVVTQEHFAGAHAFGGDSAVGLEADAEIGSGAAGAGTADNFISLPQRNCRAGCASKGLRFFGDDADAGFEIEFAGVNERRIECRGPRAVSAGVANAQMMAGRKIRQQARFLLRLLDFRHGVQERKNDAVEFGIGDKVRGLLATQRSAKDAGKTEHSGAAAGETARRIVRADDFALHAEHRRLQRYESQRRKL